MVFRFSLSLLLCHPALIFVDNEPLSERIAMLCCGDEVQYNKRRRLPGGWGVAYQSFDWVGKNTRRVASWRWFYPQTKIAHGKSAVDAIFSKVFFLPAKKGNKKSKW